MLKAWRCWGIIERQPNQQQKAKLEKKMYNTLTVSPNIIKPLFKQHLRWATTILQTPTAYKNFTFVPN